MIPMSRRWDVVGIAVAVIVWRVGIVLLAGDAWSVITRLSVVPMSRRWAVIGIAITGMVRVRRVVFVTGVLAIRVAVAFARCFGMAALVSQHGSFVAVHGGFLSAQNSLAR